jgi:ElaB/YqjD/DUF883 family membrane-anchored ribosome-binding protein
MDQSKSDINGKKENRSSASQKEKETSFRHEGGSTADPISRENQKRTRAAQKDKIEKHYEQIKNTASEYLEEAQSTFSAAQETLKEYTEELSEHVKENPLVSVLIAGGIGFILSTLLRK